MRSYGFVAPQVDHPGVSVPALNEANVRHLLRRTEVVDRPDRVARLMSLGSMSAAVDDVMNVSSSPVPASYSGVDSNWRRGVRLAEHWLGQMATATRPFGERMALFWHGHIVSSMAKVGFAPMAEQIDLYRRTGLGPRNSGGNIATLIKTASVQPAMLEYLDNDRNKATSPNQNFARELMELFVLGVGNYTEADVEAATAAWTGHGRDGATKTYRFRPNRHEASPQRFLGRTINAGTPSAAGNETIDVMLGTGTPGAGTVSAGANAGRPAPHVAAEFLSRKLWQEFGEAESGRVPSGVLRAMTGALLSSNFDIRPWVRAMLLHDDFYASATRTGLVRQPAEYVVALLVATGVPAYGGRKNTIPFWLMEEAGQRLLFPPNVSGWRPNRYWVNASTMTARQAMVSHFLWHLKRDTYDGADAHLQFERGRISRREVETLGADRLVDRFTDLCGLDPAAQTGRRIVDHVNHPSIERWMRLDVPQLLLAAPEMHIA
ncbi:MAG: DUF1800 family protein [Ilumatobacter sp.]